MSKPAVSLLSQQIAEPVEKKVDPADCPHRAKLDPRVKRTRKLLGDALKQLLREREYGDISVADIADRATVNRATFYAHFSEKRELMTAVMQEDLESALLTQLNLPAPMNSASLTRLATAVYEYVDDLLGKCPKKADEFAPHLVTTLQGTIQEMLKHWLDSDPGAIELFHGAHKSVVAGTLAWSIYGGAYNWSRKAKRRSAEESAREVISLLVRLA